MKEKKTEPKGRKSVSKNFLAKIHQFKALRISRKFMIETSMIKLTQFNKTGSMGKNFNSAAKIKIYIHSQN